ncbi:MAG: TonB-dependent siderophore receptor, partial [Vicinamibacteraceae bacterium]
MLSKAIPVSACVLVIHLVLPSVAEAQTAASGTVRGSVVDPSDGVVIGVNLTLAPVGGGAGRTVSTDTDGQFVFSGLPEGVYMLRAESAGFLPFERQVTADREATIEVPVRLEVGGTELITVVPEDRGYRPTLGTTATKLAGVPARDVPFAIEAVPSRVLEEQEVQTVNEALRNVSGIGPTVGWGGSNSRYVIRGFAAAAQLRNGFRHNPFVPITDMANVDQVEVVKGPASALYGSFDPGGLVNILTKRPLARRRTEVTLTAGSFDHVRPTVDLTGPVTGSGDARYRLNAAFQTSGSHRQFIDQDTVFAAPAVEWRPTPHTSLLIEGDFLYRDSGFDRGFGNDAVVLTLPRERNLGEPVDHLRYRGGSARYVLDHRFSDRWALRNGLSVTSATSDAAYFGAASPLVEDRLYNRRPFTSDDRQTDIVAQAELYGTLGGGRMLRHQVMTGVELTRDVHDFDLQRGDTAPINLRNPVYGAVPAGMAPYSIGTFTNRAVAVYAQDLVSVGSRWKVLVGARYTGQFSKADMDFDLFAGTFERDRLSHDVSPRAGVTFQPGSLVSLYASVGRSFRSIVDSIAAGGILPEPSIGRMVEGGLKADLRGGQLVPTLSVFRVTRDKVLVADPNDPFGPQIQTGEQESTGTEVTLNARLMRGWEALSSYAYTKAVVTKDTTIPVGARLVNVPRHTFSLWTTYALPQHVLSGLGIGGGVFYLGDRAANATNSFDLPAYTVVDAALFYRRRPVCGDDQPAQPVGRGVYGLWRRLRGGLSRGAALHDGHDVGCVLSLY